MIETVFIAHLLKLKNTFNTFYNTFCSSGMTRFMKTIFWRKFAACNIMFNSTAILAALKLASVSITPAFWYYKQTLQN